MTVIYLFVSPSGRAYAGRHTCQHEGWPRRGSGALPSGYRGSGKLWANVTLRHGPAIRWIILRRFGPDAARADIDAAERRAIRLVRAMWGERCVNILSGGDGFTSAESRETLSRPEVKAKLCAVAQAMWADPEVRAKLNAAQNRPEVKAKLSAAARTQVQTSEGRAHLASIQVSARDPVALAKRSSSHKALAMTPERRAHLDRIGVAAASPEARAKAAATRARNKALREGQPA